MDFDNYEAEQNPEDRPNYKVPSDRVGSVVDYTDDNGRIQRAPVDYAPHYATWRETSREGRLWPENFHDNTDDFKQTWLQRFPSIVATAKAQAIATHKARQTALAEPAAEPTADTNSGGPEILTPRQRSFMGFNARNKVARDARRTFTTGEWQYGRGWQEGWSAANIFAANYKVPLGQGARSDLPNTQTKSPALDDDSSAHEALENLGNKIHSGASDALKANDEFNNLHVSLLTNMYHSAVAHQIGGKEKAKALSHFASAVSNVQELARMKQADEASRGLAPAGGGVAPEIREAHAIHMGYLRRPWNR